MNFDPGQECTSRNLNKTSVREKSNRLSFSELFDDISLMLTDGPLGGGGGRAKYKKKYSRRGKLNEKNSCAPINLKKYSCYCLKKNSYKEFDNEKKFLRLENSPPPPIIFLMVRP